MPSTFVDPSLAARLEDAQAWRAANYMQAIQQKGTSDAALIMVAGAPVVYGGAGIPVNRAIGLGMHGPVTADDLDRVEHFYSDRGADSAIDLCPLADPSLLSLLQTRGYSMCEWKSMLFLPLPSQSTSSINPAIRVTRATPEQAELWVATSARGFDETDEVSDSTLRIIRPNFMAPNAHCYFAWMGDTPIGTGGMYPHQGVVELGGASTLIAYRQQGAQSALIQQRLADAYALGCDLAAILTSPGNASQRNMQRHGFELAYTRALCVRPLTS